MNNIYKAKCGLLQMMSKVVIDLGVRVYLALYRVFVCLTLQRGGGFVIFHIK